MRPGSEHTPVLLLGAGSGEATCGILYLAGYLRRGGIEAFVRLYDEDEPPAKAKRSLAALVARVRPRLVGISLKWFHHVHGALRIARSDLGAVTAGNRILVAGGKSATGTVSTLSELRPALSVASRPRAHSIAAGNVYQVNLCRMLDAPLRADADPFALAQRLSAGNPAPYQGVLDLADDWIVTASPELFLSREGDVLHSAPIKGTAVDREGFADKDFPENIMITDLVRNDLGRISRPGTVTVTELLQRQEHPGLVHLVSTVQARITPTTGSGDILAAIRLVAAGDAIISPSVTRTLLSHFAPSVASERRHAAAEKLVGLSDREREVATAVGAGASNAEIASMLFMSEATVKAHVSRLLNKLSLSNRVQIAILVHDGAQAGPQA